MTLRTASTWTLKVVCHSEFRPSALLPHYDSHSCTGTASRPTQPGSSEPPLWEPQTSQFIVLTRILLSSKVLHIIKKFKIFIFLMTTKLETEMWLLNDTHWRWDRSVSIVTSQWTAQERNYVSIPGSENGFISSPKRQDRICVPPSLLFNRHQWFVPRIY